VVPEAHAARGRAAAKGTPSQEAVWRRWNIEVRLLNVESAKAAASEYAAVSIVLDKQPDDGSHSLVKDYAEALNDQVAEQLHKAMITSYPTKSA
jgi:hypothetical protein